MRNTNPVWKRSRRLGFSVLESGKEFKNRRYAPGQHGQDRRKLSEYGKQLNEKQKLRSLYGVNERQFRRLFILATKREDVTGLAFMRILESRLDNLVYRSNFAPTRRAARQLVNHGHINVNGNRVDIASYLCKPGDIISVREGSQELAVIKNSLEANVSTVAYVELNKEKMTSTYIREAERNELAQDIQESQIVEYYNRLL
ncbi:MAG: 30S ribosomal protein S4 [Bacillales bacterium]